ncbi:integrase repeat-containing protein [Moritella sp. F3]|uniref:integrase repeat-containing protein n=1 Tax=Moritella sp. F3 TaxID=2718882 RepID=UPI0018E138B9|nr:integrase repeat-containing protein [Moritella sp. F3]GIC77650.1 hypothetical protein FMO001_23770 [Moritella sp. F1]GIC82063.1 hypothetical protein FMO003_23440 [Moritella sp. F3]
MTEQIKYKTFTEASAAAAILQIKSSNDYARRHNLDPQLPKSPGTYYKDFKTEGGWLTFLYKRRSQKYKTFELASNAAGLKLKIKTGLTYESEYKADPKLPSRPDLFYPDFEEKGGWDALLHRGSTVNYSTFEEASKAAIKLDIKNPRQYRDKSKFNTKLPCSPDKEYSDFDSKGGWTNFLNLPVIYTYEEASNAVVKLGIETYEQYKTVRKLDPRLPGYPHKYYDKFIKLGGWRPFARKAFYKTFFEASAAAVKLNIYDYDDYKINYKKDPQLHSSPSFFYEDFAKRGGWDNFLKRKGKYNYNTASEAAKKLGIVDYYDYVNRYKEDRRLPRFPSTYFEKFDKLGGWERFLQLDKYNYQEASKAVLKLGVDSAVRYETMRISDPRLPVEPKCYYLNFTKLGGWDSFLQKCTKYSSFRKASIAATKLGIVSASDYTSVDLDGKLKYKQDPLLPSNPKLYYKHFKKLGGWNKFLKQTGKYTLLHEASNAAVKLGIKTASDYLIKDSDGIQKYKQDPRLPASPQQYFNDFKLNGGWKTFLQKH